MEKYTVIIPVSTLTEEERAYLKKAIASVPENARIMIVVPDKSILAGLGEGLEVIENKSGNSNFSSQVNIGVENCKTEWFTVLELDDELRPNIFKNKELYEKYNPDSIYLSLVEVRDVKGEVQGFLNEMGWANSFCNEIGKIGMEELMLYYDFHCTGAIIKKNDFLEVGGLKPSMRIGFWYEFLMRAKHCGKNIYVVPKVGYYHTVERPGSLSESWKQDITVEEGQWWIKLAQSEYYSKEDRKKTYDKYEEKTHE